MESRTWKDILGKEYIEYTDDDGCVIAEGSVCKHHLTGEPYLELRDRSGAYLGRCEERKNRLGESYLQFWDKNGEPVATGRRVEDWLGNASTEYRDENGDLFVIADGQRDLFGGRYTRYRRTGAAHAASESGSSLTAFLIVVLGLGLTYVGTAWRDFVAQNEALLSLLLVYGVPALLLPVVALSCAVKDRRLFGAGLLEGAATASVAWLTFWLCLKFATPRGEYFLRAIKSWDVGGVRFLAYLTAPFVLFVLIYLPLLLLAAAYRHIAAAQPDALGNALQGSNTLRLSLVNGFCSLVLFVLYISLELQEGSIGLFIGAFLFWGVAAFLAARLVNRLALRILES